VTTVNPVDAFTHALLVERVVRRAMEFPYKGAEESGDNEIVAMGVSGIRAKVVAKPDWLSKKTAKDSKPKKIQLNADNESWLKKLRDQRKKQKR
jgi:hypothetical protein